MKGNKEKIIQPWKPNDRLNCKKPSVEYVVKRNPEVHPLKV